MMQLRSAKTLGTLSKAIVAVFLAGTAVGWSNRAVAASDYIFIDGFDQAIYFLVPYSADGSLLPSPASTQVARAAPSWDVAFIVNTSGSMAGPIGALKTNFESNIFPSLQARAANVAFGVAEQSDVPYSTFGTYSCDVPFGLGNYVSILPSATQASLNALSTRCGSDAPDAEIPAIYHALTGGGITWPGGTVAPVISPEGTFGALEFRADAFPIIFDITDAPQHNGARALDKSGTNYSSVENAYSFSTWTAANTLSAMQNVGAKFVGIAADGGVRGEGVNDPYGFEAYLSDFSGSYVAPGAFAHGAGCAANQCCTGVNGNGVAPDGPGGTCRLVYSIAGTGSGIANAIVSGFDAITSVASDLYVEALTDPSETTDAVGDFLLNIEPVPSGGTDQSSGAVCVDFSSTKLADNFTGAKATPGPDGVPDTITQIDPAAIYCFNVTPKPNRTVPATSSPQTFHAHLRGYVIRSAGYIPFGIDREVIFIVPPAGH